MSGDQTVFYRAFPATLQTTEVRGQRTLSGRLVPYNVAADVLDLLPDGRMDIYREGFRPGAFSGQASRSGKAISKISLIHRHEGGLGYLGPFTGLREGPDGLYGEAMILPGVADDVAALLGAGVDELSVEFRAPRPDSTSVDDAGVRWRLKAHLDQVALEPKGAYSQAQVLSFRSELDAEAEAEAERQATETAERERAEADELAERERAEAEEAEAERQAAETRERRAQWVELTDRLDAEKAKQLSYVHDYGLTRPGGLGSIRR